MTSSEDNNPSTSESPKWPIGSFFDRLQNMSDNETWNIVYGVDSTSETETKGFSWRVKEEIKLIGLKITNSTKNKTFIAKGMVDYISDFLHKATRSLCQFDHRFFPSEWILPENCCAQHYYSREQPEGKHTMIVVIRLYQIQICLKRTKESKIGSGLPRKLEEDSNISEFHNAHRFYRSFLEAAVEYLYGYNIMWEIDGGGRLEDEINWYNQHNPSRTVGPNDMNGENEIPADKSSRMGKRSSKIPKIKKSKKSKHHKKKKRKSRSEDTSGNSSPTVIATDGSSPESEDLSVFQLLKKIGTTVNFQQIKQAMEVVQQGRKRLSENDPISEDDSKRLRTQKSAFCIRSTIPCDPRLESKTYLEMLENERIKEAARKRSKSVDDIEHVADTVTDSSIELEIERIQTFEEEPRPISIFNNPRLNSGDEDSTRNSPSSVISPPTSVFTMSPIHEAHSQVTYDSIAPLESPAIDSDDDFDFFPSLVETSSRPASSELKDTEECLDNSQSMEKYGYIDSENNYLEMEQEDTSNSEEDQLEIADSPSSTISSAHGSYDTDLIDIEDSSAHETILPDQEKEEDAEIISTTQNFSQVLHVAETTTPDHVEEVSLKATNNVPERAPFTMYSTKNQLEHLSTPEYPTARRISLQFKPLKISNQKPDIFKQYHLPTMKELEHLPKQLRYMSRSNKTDNRYWFDVGTVKNDFKRKLFGDYYRDWMRSGHFMRHKVNSVCSQLDANCPYFILKEETRDSPALMLQIEELRDKPIPLELLSKMVCIRMNARFFIDYFDQVSCLTPACWANIDLNKLGDFTSSDDEVADIGKSFLATLSDLPDMPTEVVMTIKKNSHILYKKIMSDLVRTMFILKLDSDGKPHFFYDGAFDIKPKVGFRFIMHSQQRPNPQMNRHPYGTPGSAPQMRRPGGFAGQPPQMHGPRMVAPPAAPLPKKKKYADKCIHPKIRELEPDAENYMALLASEQKLDSTLSRKKLDIQEALKRPSKVKKRLRIYISHTFIEEKQPEKDTDEASLPMWELRVEGRLLDEQPPAPAIPGQRPVPKRKFSSFFKSLVIELDKEMYGPDQHLVEWHRTPQTNETDGFQVKRAGDRPVKCRILLLLDNHPAKFKLHPRLAKVLGIATETRPKIIEALWQYIKTHGLQDPQERDIINCDTFLSQCFGVNRMRFMEVPNKLHQLLQQTDPLEFNHIIQRPKEGQEQVSTCYDIDVEMEDPVKQFMHTFVHSPGLANDIQTLDQKCYDIIEQINELKTRRDFYARFYTEPAEFIKSWVMSQNSDLKTMNELSGDLEAERFAESYVRPETEEGVQRYMFQKVNQKRHELEQSLGVRSN